MPIVLYLSVIAPFMWVVLIDYMGLVEGLKRRWFYRKYLSSVDYKPYDWRPLDCSVCLTFWSSLALLYLTGGFGAHLLSAFLFAYITIILRKWIINN